MEHNGDDVRGEKERPKKENGINVKANGDSYATRFVANDTL